LESDCLKIRVVNEFFRMMEKMLFQMEFENTHLYITKMNKCLAKRLPEIFLGGKSLRKLRFADDALSK
jgi:hypothetical protein